jgi:hypothetical protein
MNANTVTETGFYWIKKDGWDSPPIVGEFVEPHGWYSLPVPHWHIPGSNRCHANADVFQVLTPRMLRCEGEPVVNGARK